MYPICWINDLPTELLIAILVTAAKNSGSIKDQHFFPFNISLVCRRWRNVAIHTHELWTSLFIRTSKSPTSIMNHMGRSESRPLQIHIGVTKVAGTWACYQGIQVHPSWKELLLPVVSRMRKIHIDTSPSHATLEEASSVLLHLLGDMSGVLALSASSGLKRGHPGGMRFTAWHEDFILPQLISLRLDGCGLDTWDQAGSSCANIEVLHIFELQDPSIAIPLAEILGVLCALPKLRILELGYHHISPSSAHEGVRIVGLENLDSLVIWNYSYRDLIVFFRHVMVPRLKTLEIGGYSYDWVRSHDQDLSIHLPLLDTLTIDQTPSSLGIVNLFAPFARHIRLFQHEGDELIEGLLHRWGRLLPPLPLQKLTTRGVPSTALSRLGGIQPTLPFLCEIVPLDEGRPDQSQTPG